MTTEDLLLKTADDLDAHPCHRISLVKRMTAILKPTVCCGDIPKRLQATSQLLAEYHPPGLASICAEYTGIEMLYAADRFVANRYGVEKAALIHSRWLRRAGTAQPYPPQALHAFRPLEAPTVRWETQPAYLPFCQPEPVAAT